MVWLVGRERGVKGEVMSYPVLFVDDEKNVLDAYKRSLRKVFNISTALGGNEALDVMRANGPFSVVVSDMQMPEMNGVEFLSHSRKLFPNTVRIMLTGNADQQTAIDAINHGDIYRFVNKPCPPAQMADILKIGIRQYQLITAEKEILEKTLKGSIQTLSQALALSKPEVFGRTDQIKKLVKQCAAKLGQKSLWEYETLAMLCQIGYVSLPDAIVQKVVHGQPLCEDQQAQFARHAVIGSELLSKIPRLDRIAKAVKYQDKHFDGSGTPSDDVAGNDIPLGARILKVVLDYQRFETGSNDSHLALSKLASNSDAYDPGVLKIFSSMIEESHQATITEISISTLQNGMILAEDIKTPQGILLVGKGQEVTPSVNERLVNFWRNGTIAERINVYTKESPQHSDEILH